MLTRLRKELYVLWPYFALSLTMEGWIAWSLSGATTLLPILELASAIVFLIQIAVLHVASVAPFGVEFREGVCNRLLSAPVSRMRIYWEKSILLFLLVVTVFYFFSLNCRLMLRMHEMVDFRVDEMRDRLNGFLLVLGMAGIWVAFTGPLLTIYMKRGYKALLASLIVSGAFFLILFCANETINGYTQNKKLYESILNASFIKPLFQRFGLALPFTVYTFPWCAAAFLLTRRLWKRLEV